MRGETAWRPMMKTFHASGLLSKFGFDDGDEPVAVVDAWYDRETLRDPRSASRWHEDILVPIARDLLVPALPVPVVFEALDTSHNPARVFEIDGHPHGAAEIDTDKPDYGDMFGAVHISIPVDYLADALDGKRSFAGLDRLSGLDLDLLTDAFTIGMSVDEIATARTDGTLAGVSTLLALRA